MAWIFSGYIQVMMHTKYHKVVNALPPCADQINVPMWQIIFWIPAKAKRNYMINLVHTWPPVYPVRWYKCLLYVMFVLCVCPNWFPKYIRKKIKSVFSFGLATIWFGLNLRVVKNSCTLTLPCFPLLWLLWFWLHVHFLALSPEFASNDEFEFGIDGLEILMLYSC